MSIKDSRVTKIGFVSPHNDPAKIYISLAFVNVKITKGKSTELHSTSS